MSGGDRCAGVSWPQVLRGLTFEAIRLYRTVGLGHSDAVLVGLGVSPEDLAVATLTKLLDPEDRTVVYRRGEASVLTYLKKVMRNDFLDLLKRKSYETTHIVDGSSTNQDGDDRDPETLDSYAGPSGSHHDVLFRDRLRELVADDKELADYIEVVWDCEVFKPDDIASLLGTTTADIQNRKKRLNTILAKHPKLREAF
jgi:DNA-directed RNA polymerase specialized sigma24 family protein